MAAMTQTPDFIALQTIGWPWPGPAQQADWQAAMAAHPQARPARVIEQHRTHYVVADGKVPHYQLQVQADEAVPYGRVAQVMALAQTAGLNKLTFITIPHK